MEQRNGSVSERKITVREAALALGVTSVLAVKRIEEEIVMLEASGYIIDYEEHTKKMLTRVE